MSKSDDNRHKADLAVGGSFYPTYEDEIFDLLEKVTENHLQQTMRSNPRRGVFQVSSLEIGLKETNKKLDNIATALKKVLQLNSPFIKAKMCSLCCRSDHEDGACLEGEYEEAQVHMVGQSRQWSGQRSQGSLKHGFRLGFQPKTHFNTKRLLNFNINHLCNFHIIPKHHFKCKNIPCLLFSNNRLSHFTINITLLKTSCKIIIHLISLQW